MADEADRSSIHAEAMLSAYIEQIRRRAASGPTSTGGVCLNCDEVAGDAVFCSPDCREDFERRENIHRRLRLP